MADVSQQPDQDQDRHGRRQSTTRGLVHLLHAVRVLVTRPRGRERPLPIVWLTPHERARPLLAVLRAQLATGGRKRVPHAQVDATGYPRDDGLRPLLRTVGRLLSIDHFGVEPLRFRRFGLVDWLMDQRLSEDGVRQEELAGLLLRRDRVSGGVAQAAERGPESLFAAVYQALAWVVRRAIPQALFRAALSGRAGSFGRPYRWFMRQQYLAPRQSVSFLGLAERLTEGVREGEKPEQLDRLLVHAFLEDLRQAYRRRPFRVRGWRRTAYPVVLLDGAATDNAGGLCCQLVNDVRNETGRDDPLLLVVAADPLPPELARETAIDEPPADDPPGLDELADRGSEWELALPEARRARRKAAWYRPVPVPADVGTGRHVSEPIEPPPAPFWARRWIPFAAVLLLVLAGIGWVDRHWGFGCVPAPWQGSAAVRQIGGECVGYSAGGFVFSREQARLRAVEEKIFEQNRRADEVYDASGGRRPYVTIVYLGTLTGNRAAPGEEAYVSEREELEGLAVAQHATITEPAAADSLALLRVVIANGGFQMRHAPDAVDMIAGLARDDPRVLGVVGLVESRASTAEAIRRLNRAGLPALAPTLSADEMYANSELYLQLAPSNMDQARLVHEYAKRQGLTGVHVYYTTGEGGSPDDDLYVKTLRADLRKELGDTQERFWQKKDPLDRECGFGGLLFFAGRWSEFGEFVNELGHCPNPPAHLVADDSVNRFMANDGLRRSAPGNVPLVYVSKAALAGCDQLRRARDAGDEVRGRFLRQVQASDLLQPARCLGNEEAAVGERVGLAYDAATMLLTAVETLAARLRHNDPQRGWQPGAVNPLAVHAEVLRENLAKGYPGVTGTIKFRADAGEPVGKRISLLDVRRIPDRAAPPVEVLACGVANEGESADCRVP